MLDFQFLGPEKPSAFNRKTTRYLWKTIEKRNNTEEEKQSILWFLCLEEESEECDIDHLSFMTSDQSVVSDKDESALYMNCAN